MTKAGLQQDQEKLNKMTKSEKGRMFLKKTQEVWKLKKIVKFCQFKFTKFLIFQNHQIM